MTETAALGLPDWSLLTANIPVAASLATALFGWFLAFVGACMAQREFDRFGFVINPIRLWWFHTFFALALILGIAMVLVTSNVTRMRAPIVAFLTLAISFTVNDVDNALVLSKQDSARIGSAGSVRTAGDIFFVFPLLALIFLLGADPNASENAKTGQSIMANKFIQDHPLYSHDQTVHGSAANLYTPSTQRVSAATLSPPPAAITVDTAGVSAVPAMADANSIVFPYIAQAQFSYEANPDDPTELSFEKDEMIEIVETKGKWWHARKTLADGTKIVGIVPSNFLKLVEG
ncbi:hypothetical protein BC831DRAFT_443715 [Entophlyctis helioformis]|nr:hypothetical protein BC831DRAFT_443715 [Entophlyctis helioformis]